MSVTTIAHGATLDATGNPTSGPSDAVGRYDRALDLLLRYHPAVIDAADGLAATDPAFPMGQAFLAYLSLTSTDVPDVADPGDARPPVTAEPGPAPWPWPEEPEPEDPDGAGD